MEGKEEEWQEGRKYEMKEGRKKGGRMERTKE